MIRMADLWQSYADRVLPPHVSEVQRTETRRAFYAGALALLSATANNLSEGSEVSEADDAVMDDLYEELQAFNRDVVADKA
jgi:hypothetical protein